MLTSFIQTARSIRSTLSRAWRERERRRIYDKFREYTMIDPDSYGVTLELAQRVQALPGCVVECGVWKGGMSAGIATVLGPERRYYLFDSFEGLPPAKDIDGPAALQWQADKNSPIYHDNCTAEEGYAKEAMHLAGALKVELIKGWFEHTLPSRKPTEPIALLRLDGDWYDSTMQCLEHLFDQVVPGGIIIVDDYYAWDGCSRAVHDFLSKRSAAERISSLRHVCFLQRRASMPSVQA